MSSTKLETASIPGVHLQVAKDFSVTQPVQPVTDPEGQPSCLQLSYSTAIVKNNVAGQTGALGINTTPTSALHVGADSSVRFELGASNKFSIGGAGNIQVDAPNVPAGRFIINDKGVGIKKSNPEYELDVNGTIQAKGLVFSGELAVIGMKSAKALDGLKPVYINPATGMLYYFG